MKTKEQIKQEYLKKETLNWDKETLDRFLPEAESYFEEWYKGFSAKEKQIKDKINALKSAKKELTQPKINEYKIQELEQQVKILQELI